MSDTAETTQQTSSDAIETVTIDNLESLLESAFRPHSDEAKLAVRVEVATLAEQLVTTAMTTSDDAIKTNEALVAEIDHKLSEQINKILHHDTFRTL